MDVLQFVFGLNSFSLLIRGCMSSQAIPYQGGNWDTTDRPCHKRCKYGYEADVEGNTMCKCYDPCAHIYCPFEGTRCAVRKKDRFCRHKTCKYEGTCKRVSKISEKKWQAFTNFPQDRYKNEVFYGLQRDSSDLTTTDLCSRQPSINSRYLCDYKLVGYYFDGLQGSCVRFRGCHGLGEFFTRRKDCNRECRDKHPKLQELRMPSRSLEDCYLPKTEAAGCPKLKRTWFFDLKRGRCVKTLGCSNLTGNSFTTRLQCKNTCKRRKPKRYQRRRRTKFAW